MFNIIIVVFAYINIEVLYKKCNTYNRKLLQLNLYSYETRRHGMYYFIIYTALLYIQYNI